MSLQLGAKVRQCRYEKGLTQENMAELLQVSPKTYARFEQNKTEIKMSVFIKICQILNQTPNDLIPK